MAVTKIIKVKVNTKACINYVTNPKKTEDKLLVTYDGCSEESADAVFKLALSNNERGRRFKQDTKALHLIQSFSPKDDISPENAHKLGLELMEKMFDGKYAFVCSTHVDKGHIHNHFVVCAAEKAMTGRKIQNDLALLHKLQKESDNLCREHGLFVIDKKKGKGKSYAEWLADKEAPTGSKKTQLRRLIDKTIIESKDFDDFIERMKSQNVIIGQGNSKKYGTVTKYRFPDEDNFHRGYSLGNFYSDENIKKRIERRVSYLESQEKKKEAKREERKARYEAMTPGEKILDKGKLKIDKMRDTSDIESSRKNVGLNRWTNIQNTKRMQLIAKKVHDRFGIDYTEIKGKISELNAENNRIASILSSKKAELDELRDLIEKCVTYKKLRIYAINEEKSSDPESYYQSHDAELNAYNDAVFTLNQRNVDLSALTMDKIKILQNRLLEEEANLENLREQQRQNERDLKELTSYQKEMDLYFGNSRT